MSSKIKGLESERDLLLNGYYAEAEGLSSIYKSGQLNRILEIFNDYEHFISERQKAINSTKLIKKITNGTRILDVTLPCDELKDIFYIAHVAACCAIFDDWQIPSSSLEKNALRNTITKSLVPDEGLSKQDIFFAETRLALSDTIRSIQILRLLGLFQKKSINVRQLSFAAGSGYRDILGTHPIPVIKSDSNILNLNQTDTLCFNLKQTTPETLVLVDNNPVLKKRYAALNAERPDSLLAIVDDVNKAINDLPLILKKKKWQPFNCFTGIRVDHRMIPDARKFITSLVPLMSDTADLIISIGSGDNPDDFIGRKKVMQNIFEYLNEKNLSPVIITMHDSCSVDELLATPRPCFGVSNITTYELLHCKLKRKKLK